MFSRYFFNASTRKCEHFIYGGCGGNKNNFYTEAECRRTCGEDPGEYLRPVLGCGEEAGVGGDDGRKAACQLEGLSHYHTRWEEFLLVVDLPCLSLE